MARWVFQIIHFYLNPDNRDSVRKKPINCFDININDRIVCAGTEQVDKESHLLFFDVRQRSLLGAYWDRSVYYAFIGNCDSLSIEIFSHEDDITDMKFHSKNPDLIVSGSTDGLICVFDISQTDEDDALLCTLNTESSVGSIDWHETALGKDLVSCITHTNDLQFYNMEDFDEAEMLVTFDRETVTSHIKVFLLIISKCSPHFT